MVVDYSIIDSLSKVSQGRYSRKQPSHVRRYLFRHPPSISKDWRLQQRRLSRHFTRRQISIWRKKRTTNRADSGIESLAWRRAGFPTNLHWHGQGLHHKDSSGRRLYRPKQRRGPRLAPHLPANRTNGFIIIKHPILLHFLHHLFKQILFRRLFLQNPSPQRRVFGRKQQ